MMNNDLLISNLNWNLPKKVQEKAIDQILKSDSFDPKLLIRPIDVHYWENSAKVLKELGFSKVKQLTPDFLVWLQDINWPGAFLIIDLLNTFPKDFLLPFLEKAIDEAIATNDDSWLDYLSIFTFNGKFQKSDFTNEKHYEALKNHEDQWDV